MTTIQLARHVGGELSELVPVGVVAIEAVQQVKHRIALGTGGVTGGQVDAVPHLPLERSASKREIFDDWRRGGHLCKGVHRQTKRDQAGGDLGAEEFHARVFTKALIVAHSLPSDSPWGRMV